MPIDSIADVFGGQEFSVCLFNGMFDRSDEANWPSAVNNTLGDGFSVALSHDLRRRLYSYFPSKKFHSNCIRYFLFGATCEKRREMKRPGLRTPGFSEEFIARPMKVPKFKVNGGQTRANNAHSTKMKLMNQGERNFRFLLCASEKETVNGNSVFAVHSFRSAKFDLRRPNGGAGRARRRYGRRERICALISRYAQRQCGAVPNRSGPEPTCATAHTKRPAHERTKP